MATLLFALKTASGVDGLSDLFEEDEDEDSIGGETD